MSFDQKDGSLGRQLQKPLTESSSVTSRRWETPPLHCPVALSSDVLLSMIALKNRILNSINEIERFCLLNLWLDLGSMIVIFLMDLNIIRKSQIQSEQKTLEVLLTMDGNRTGAVWTLVVFQFQASITSTPDASRKLRNLYHPR